MRTPAARARAFAGLLVLVLLSSASPRGAGAAGTSDMERFQKRLGKSASPTDNVAAPVLCVCKDGSLNQDRAGVLVQVPQAVNSGTVLVLNCNVLIFDSTTGQANGAAGCPVWETLPK